LFFYPLEEIKMSKNRDYLLKGSSNRQQPKLTLWQKLSEEEEGTISGGIVPMLPWDLIHIRIRGNIPTDEVAL
jgi:hypothetical protein